MQAVRLGVLALVLLSAASLGAHDLQPLIAPYLAVAPTIDGDLTEWSGSDFVQVDPQTGVFDAESGTTDDAADLSFSFAVANDDRYLYVAVRIVDDVLVLDSNRDPSDRFARAWMDDAIEIFLDGDHSHSPNARDRAGVEFETGGEFAVVANGAVTSDQSGVPGTGGDPEFWEASGSYDAPSGAAYQSPWDTEAGGFAVEARLSFRLMGPEVGPGSRIGFTISAHDDDDGDNRDAALYWKGISPSAWKDESGWGDLILSDPSTAVESTTLGQIKEPRR
ncbi:sugar-binding protein [Candidatus Latescibacterota bacterium]